MKAARVMSSAAFIFHPLFFHGDGLKDGHMEQYQPTPPDASEIPFGFTEVDGVHEQTWEEKYQADENTLKARAWSSDFLAAFRTAQAYFARECRDGLREAYGADWAKVLDQSFKV